MSIIFMGGHSNKLLTHGRVYQVLKSTHTGVIVEDDRGQRVELAPKEYCIKH